LTFLIKIEHDNIPQTLKINQDKMLETHNENRKEKEYHVGQEVCEMKYGVRNNISRIIRNK